MQRRCAIIDPAVSSTLHCRQGILRQILTQYESPTPVHFKALASADIPDLSVLVGIFWQYGLAANVTKS